MRSFVGVTNMVRERTWGWLVWWGEDWGGDWGEDWEEDWEEDWGEGWRGSLGWG